MTSFLKAQSLNGCGAAFASIADGYGDRVEVLAWNYGKVGVEALHADAEAYLCYTPEQAEALAHSLIVAARKARGTP